MFFLRILFWLIGRLFVWPWRGLKWLFEPLPDQAPGGDTQEEVLMLIPGVPDDLNMFMFH